tara:strand:+ start:549 stop:1004 length:456 start_codon:yes stop_codon:yes gene_type:complete
MPIETLKEAKEHLRSNFEKGCKCPACGQFVKLYKRKFNTVMARSLISLYQLGGGFHHVKEIIKGISDTGTNDFSKLKYYGFIAEEINVETQKRTSGNWKITQTGIDFVLRNITVHSYVLLYNGKMQGFSGEQINIETALGNRFNYAELMEY